MTFIEQLEALERLHLLIQRKATGTPEQLAGRFNVSPRTIRNFIQILKYRDLSVNYCRGSQTYYYESEVEVQFFYVKRAKTK
jgi:predicted DNA-binding transcriptional regulator YafY